MLAFFAHILVNMGFAWLVWGLIACSLLTSPSVSFSSHLVLMLVLPLGILVGLYAGFGKFDNNSGCFTLLLAVVYWCLVHFLPTLGCCVLSCHFSSSLVWAQQLHRVLPNTYRSQIPLAPQTFWCDGDIINSCHFSFLYLVIWQWIWLIPLMSSFRTQGDWRSICGVKSPIIFTKDSQSIGNVESQVTSVLMSACPPPIMVHAELVRVVLLTLFHICCWCKLSTHCCQCMPYTHNALSLMGDTCKWNATVNTFLLTHNLSWLRELMRTRIAIQRKCQ